jgi:hypothetical protein
MFTLFAQVAKNAKADELSDKEGYFFCGVYLVFLLIEFGMSVLLASAASRTLRLCRRSTRTMEPAEAWLNLVPLVHYVWQFVTVKRVGASLRKEFSRRGISTSEDDFGRELGILMCIMRLIICTWPISVVCFIVYYKKISGFTKQLALKMRLDDIKRKHEEESNEE